MAQEFLDELVVLPLREQERGARVPETVEAGIGWMEAGIGWKTGTFEEPSEGAISKVGGVDDAPISFAKMRPPGW